MRRLFDDRANRVHRSVPAYLGDHVKAEEQALQAYHDLLKDRTDDLATYLVKMIVSDERRHHQMFADMQRTLESYMHWRDIEPHVPPIRITGDTNALLRATEELLRLEKADAKELRRLRRSWHRATGERKLWALLVSTAEIDTKKHIRVLRYLRTLLK